MEIKIKKLHPNAVLPFYATEGSNAMDLTAVDKNLTDYDLSDLKIDKIKFAKEIANLTLERMGATRKKTIKEKQTILKELEFNEETWYILEK